MIKMKKSYHLCFFFLKSTDIYESISASIDSFTPTEETELFMSLPTDDPITELAIEPSPFCNFITLAFSPRFFFTKLDSPDLTLETSREEL